MNPLGSFALVLAVMLLGLPRVEELLVTLADIQRRQQEERRRREDEGPPTERSPVGFRPDV